jgi:hypothetical protein
MLRRTSAILDTVTAGVVTHRAALGGPPMALDPERDSSGFKHGRLLWMLGVNYRWSSIVLEDARARPSLEEGAANAYGDGSAGDAPADVRAGDRAPDAPGLRVAAAPHGQFKIDAKVALFDVLVPDAFTVMLFLEADHEGVVLERMLAVTRRQPQGTVRTAAILPAHSAAKTVVGTDLSLIDEEEYAAKHFFIKSHNAGTKAVVVRPDGVVGAILREAAGLEKYFGLVFRSG